MQALADGFLVTCCTFLMKVTLSRGVLAFMSQRLELGTFSSRTGGRVGRHKS